MKTPCPLPLVLLLALGTAVTPARAADPVMVPAGLNAKHTSPDPAYGYSRQKPIKVGTGPAAERAYFASLRDEAGKPVKFTRKGSFGEGPDGNVLDGYEIITSTGRTLMLYIDMYHEKMAPREQPAPKGLFQARE